MKQRLSDYGPVKGYYLFFDKEYPTKKLSDEQYGILWKETNCYAQFGAIPKLESETLQILFEMLKPSIDESVHNQLVSSLVSSYKGSMNSFPKGDRPSMYDWLVDGGFCMDDLTEKDLSTIRKYSGTRENSEWDSS